MESTHSSLDHHGYHQISFPSSMQTSFQCLWLQDSLKELHPIFIKSSRSKPPWLFMSTSCWVLMSRQEWYSCWVLVSKQRQLLIRPKESNALTRFWRVGNGYYLSFPMRWCARGEVLSKKHWCAGKELVNQKY